MDNYHIIKEMAEEAIAVIIPEFMDKFGLYLNSPAISTFTANYKPFYAELFYPIGKYGLIKFGEEECIKKRVCGSLAAHGMGHAAVFQNSKGYKEFEKHRLTEGHDLLGMVNEGIAEIFQKTGIKILEQNRYFNTNSYYLELFKLFRYEKFWHGVLFPDEYGMGPQIVKHMEKKGVTIKDLVETPLEYLPYLEKNWQNMISFPNGVSLKFWERVYSCFFKD